MPTTHDSNRSRDRSALDLSSIGLLQPSPHTPGHALFAKRMALAQGGNAKASKEFSPLLRTVRKNRQKQLQRDAAEPVQLNKGILSYEEIEFSDSMESLAHSRAGASMTMRHGNSFVGKVPGKIAGDPKESIPLKKQEDLLEQNKNEIFGLKMKLYFLLKKLEESTPESMRGVTTENIELHTKVSQLTQINEDLKRKLEDVRPSAGDDSVVHKLKSYEGEIEDLKLASDRLEDELKDREDEIEHLRAKLQNNDNDDDDNEEVQRLRDEVSELRHAKDNDELVVQLRNEIEELKEDLRHANDGQDVEEQAADDLRDEIAALKEDLRRARMDTSGDDRQVQALNEEIDELREELEHAKHEQSSDERLIQELKDKVEDLKDELRHANENTEADKLQDRIDELEATIQRNKDLETKSDSEQVLTLKDEIEDLQLDLQDSRKEVERLQSQLQEKSGFMSELRQNKQQQRDELEEKLSKLSQENETLQKQHKDELLAANERYRKDLERKQDEFSHEIEDIKRESEAMQHDLQRTIDDLEKNIDATSDRIETLEYQINERDREVSGLKLELRSVKSQLDKSDIEIVELNNTIDELKRSQPNRDTSILRNKTVEDELVKTKHELRKNQDELYERKRLWTNEVSFFFFPPFFVFLYSLTI